MGRQFKAVNTEFAVADDEQMSTEEIAAKLGVSRQTVLNDIESGLRKLRKNSELRRLWEE